MSHQMEPYYEDPTALREREQVPRDQSECHESSRIVPEQKQLICQSHRRRVAQLKNTNWL